MKNHASKVLPILAGALAFVALQVTSAFAVADAAVVTLMDDTGEGLKDTLVGIGTAILPYAAAVVAIVIGWRFVRKFVRA